MWGGSVDTELYLVKDVWAHLGRQEPQGKKCKVGGKSLALFACSLSITCLPSLAERWKKRRSAAWITIYHSRLYPGCMWLQTASSTVAARVTALCSVPAQAQSQSHISWRRGGEGAYTLWQNYCSFHLSIFIIVQSPPPRYHHRRLALEGMIHDMLTLSLIRAATCSSQRLFTGIGFV